MIHLLIHGMDPLYPIKCYLCPRTSVTYVPGLYRLIITVLIGIAGAFVGGYVGSFLGLGTVTGFNLGSILLATGGAILLLLLYRFIKK